MKTTLNKTDLLPLFFFNIDRRGITRCKHFNNCFFNAFNLLDMCKNDMCNRFSAKHKYPSHFKNKK